MLTWGGEGVGVAVMEAAGEMLQHSLPLLALSDQHHDLQERSEESDKKQKLDCEVFGFEKVAAGESNLRAWSRVSPVKSKNLRYSSPTTRL